MSPLRETLKFKGKKDCCTHLVPTLSCRSLSLHCHPQLVPPALSLAASLLHLQTMPCPSVDSSDTEIIVSIDDSQCNGVIKACYCPDILIVLGGHLQGSYIHSLCMHVHMCEQLCRAQVHLLQLTLTKKFTLQGKCGLGRFASVSSPLHTLCRRTWPYWQGKTSIGWSWEAEFSLKRI